MKNTNFYPSIWQTFPNSLDMAAHWEAQNKRSLDLTLNNTQAEQLNVAAMSLNINGFAIIDKQGNELQLDEFTTQARLQLKGQHTGLFIKTRKQLSLPKGAYAKIRFYLKPWDNRFVLNDYSTKEIFDVAHLDFDIKGGLEIDTERPFVLKLRFDFKPFTFKGLYRLAKRKLLGNTKPGLAHSFAD